MTHTVLQTKYEYVELADVAWYTYGILSTVHIIKHRKLSLKKIVWYTSVRYHRTLYSIINKCPNRKPSEILFFPSIKYRLTYDEFLHSVTCIYNWLLIKIYFNRVLFVFFYITQCIDIIYVICHVCQQLPWHHAHKLIINNRKLVTELSDINVGM